MFQIACYSLKKNKNKKKNTQSIENNKSADFAAW